MLLMSKEWVLRVLSMLKGGYDRLELLNHFKVPLADRLEDYILAATEALGRVLHCLVLESSHALIAAKSFAALALPRVLGK